MDNESEQPAPTPTEKKRQAFAEMCEAAMRGEDTQTFLMARARWKAAVRGSMPGQSDVRGDHE